MSWKYNPFTGKLDFYKSVSSFETNTIYFGDSDTDGSWRLRVNGTDFVRERREGGVWIEKSADTP